MHRALSARWINRALSIGEASASSSVPLFLCPAVGASSRFHRTPKATPLPTPIHTRRLNHTEATIQDAPITTSENSSLGLEIPKRRLPLNCTGCGAFTQTSDPQMLGYFDPESKRVKKWLNPKAFERQHTTSQEDGVVDDVLKTLDPGQLEALGLDPSLLVTGAEKEGNIAPSTPPTLLLRTIQKLTSKKNHCPKINSLSAIDATIYNITAPRATQQRLLCSIPPLSPCAKPSRNRRTSIITYIMSSMLPISPCRSSLDLMFSSATFQSGHAIEDHDRASTKMIARQN